MPTACVVRVQLPRPSMLRINVIALFAVRASGWSLAFGSCHHQDLPAPALTAAASLKPEVFVWLGDNIYNDLSVSGNVCEPMACSTSRLNALKDRLLLTTYKFLLRFKPRLAATLSRQMVEKHNSGSTATDGDGLSRRYAQLANKTEYIAILDAAGAILATWDDHDYCRNNAGASCPVAERSRELFLDFWRGAGSISARGAHAGVYDSATFGEYDSPSRSVQVLLLDLRSFRSDLRHSPPNSSDAYGEQEETVQLVGEEQWRWLATQLRKPAAVRVICSSISFAASYNGEESWALYPHERRRMFSLLTSTGASGVVFISGDVHYGEMSAIGRADGAPYTLFDVTSSGLTQSKGWLFHPSNTR